MSDRGENFEWEGAEDITALSEAELKERLEGLVEEERGVSYRRRVLHGRIDLIRAELVRRGAITRSSEELVRVLMGDWRP
jgi:RsiG-like